MDFLEKSNHREEMNTTVAHASGSESSVFLSVKFRVIPWQILLLLLVLLSVKFRVYAYAFLPNRRSRIRL